MTTIRPISDAQLETDMMQIESLLFAVSDEAPELSADDFVKTLLFVMRRAGTRDALLSMLCSARIDQRNKFAMYMTVLGWDERTALRERSMQVQDNWHATLAALLYSMEFYDVAFEVLRLVHNPQHRMAGLLRLCLDAELSGTAWCARMQALDIDECLRFVRPDGAVQG